MEADFYIVSTVVALLRPLVRELRKLTRRIIWNLYQAWKWFGSLFKRLPVAEELQPLLLDLLSEENWQAVEQRIWDAAAILLRHQNELGIAPEIPVEAQNLTDKRHYLACDFWNLTVKSGAQTGAVTLIQRFGWYGTPAALNLNPHFHLIYVDGVFDRQGCFYMHGPLHTSFIQRRGGTVTAFQTPFAIGE